MGLVARLKQDRCSIRPPLRPFLQVSEIGLKAGEYKRCKKCDRDLPFDMFRDLGVN